MAEELDLASIFYRLLAMLPGLPLQQAQVPFTGFLGPQRMKSGDPATWLNIGVNIDGLEWLIPQLTPNQSPEDVQALLSGNELTPEQRRRIEDRAIDFAVQYERAHPNTFAKYPSVPEAEAAAMGASKNLFVKPLPTAPPAYPGRPYPPKEQ